MAKQIIKAIKKVLKTKENRFLKSKAFDSMPEMEIGIYNKLKNLNYTILEILNYEEHQIFLLLQKKRHMKNLFIALQEKIAKEKLDIDITKYPAFKNYVLKK